MAVLYENDYNVSAFNQKAVLQFFEKDFQFPENISFLKKISVFQKICLEIEVLKTFKI